MLVALGLAGFAYWQRSVAVEERNAALAAQARALVAQSRALAALAREHQASGDPVTAVNIAIEALPGGSQADRPYVVVAEAP